jgi:hypothetical protein
MKRTNQEANKQTSKTQIPTFWFEKEPTSPSKTLRLSPKKDKKSKNKEQDTSKL